MRGRIGRMEKRVDLDKDKPCPECGGRIVFVERHENGTATYPLVGPCPSCEGPSDGRYAS